MRQASCYQKLFTTSGTSIPPVAVILLLSFRATHTTRGMIAHEPSSSKQTLYVSARANPPCLTSYAPDYRFSLNCFHVGSSRFAIVCRGLGSLSTNR